MAIATRTRRTMPPVVNEPLTDAERWENVRALVLDMQADIRRSSIRAANTQWDRKAKEFIERMNGYANLLNAEYFAALGAAQLQEGQPDE